MLRLLKYTTLASSFRVCNHCFSLFHSLLFIVFTGTETASAPPFEVGVEVLQRVDGDRRALNRRNHSAGHLIALASRILGFPLIERKGYHFLDGPYVEFEGKLPNADSAKDQFARQVHISLSLLSISIIIVIIITFVNMNLGKCPYS